MSDATFPKLPGLAWSVMFSDSFPVTVQQAIVPDQETRISYSDRPQVGMKLSYEFLRDKNADETGLTELQTIRGFFRARQGNFQRFLLNVSDLTQNDADSVVTGANIGTGDGTTTAFACKRTYGGATEYCYAPQVTATYVSGMAQAESAYSVDSGGNVIFVSAPAASAPITVDFIFLYRVRFDKPAQDFENFMFQLYRLQSLDLVSVRA